MSRLYLCMNLVDVDSLLFVFVCRSGASLSHGAQSYMEDHVTVCCDLVKQQCDPSSNIGSYSMLYVLPRVANMVVDDVMYTSRRKCCHISIEI